MVNNYSISCRASERKFRVLTDICVKLEKHKVQAKAECHSAQKLKDKFCDLF